jgi:Insulin-induced protein (INSIG)
MQLSITLALTNPFLWYLLDRTAAGLALSTAIGVFGTAALLAINPGLIPAPTTANASRGYGGGGVNNTASSAGNGALAGLGGLSDEHIGVATWIGSVLFCSCVCFGNIGRLLTAG